MKNKFFITLTSCFLFLLIGNYGSEIKPSLLAHEESHSHHGIINIPNNAAIPAVDLVIHEDTLSGWNLEIRTENFRFAPKNVNQPGDFQEGHAHLYINGKKITRLYSNWYYLGELKLGKNEIKVTLTSNDHKDLVYQGNKIEDTSIMHIK